MKRKMKFVITGVRDSWRWDLESPNGIVLATCVGTFKTRAAAIKSVERLQDECERTTILVNGEVLE